MMTNTSPERVDRLIHQSDRIYDTIDPLFDGERSYRRMLRVGLNALALTLHRGESVDIAGQTLLTLPSTLSQRSQPLDTLSNLYADVTRATVDREGHPETDARHAVHLMKLSTPYAEEYYPSLNTGKIAAYALTHDIIEAYAGDTPSLGMTTEQEAQKHLIETHALVQLRNDYGEQFPEFIDLIESYEALNDPEARYVKTFDKLDPGFTHFYSRGVEIKNRYDLSEEGFMRAIDATTERMQSYSSEFTQLMSDRDELTRRVARVAFQKAA